MSEIALYNEDCLLGMRRYPDSHFDTIITDPPYGLKFMGKKWDYEIPSVEAFQGMLRVAKPGATLLCFGGTRTWHRIACNIEDAGWEIRDTLMWLYGSGFPKSLNIGKAIDKLQGNERKVVGERYRNVKPYDDVNNEWNSNNTTVDFIYTKGTSPFEGWGTALKPAYEPIIMAMKPNEGSYAENALRWGVAGLNIDEARIPLNGDKPRIGNTDKSDSIGYGVQTWQKSGTMPPQGRFPANLLLDEESARMLDEDRVGF